MCTASWLSGPGGDGYELFFNRDESRRRGEALPPREERIDGVCVLLPVDADAGGTWIGVNEHGLTLGLLNAWHLEGAATGTRSRGQLVRGLLSMADIAAVRSGLAGQDLGDVRGFTLLALEPGLGPRLFEWDGRELAEREAEAPLSSSSYDAPGAARERSLLFAGVSPEREAVLAFHASHEPHGGAGGPLSPCMHRSDARTVSSSHVSVGPGEVSLAYAPGPPCRTPYGRPLSLARRNEGRCAR